MLVLLLSFQSEQVQAQSNWHGPYLGTVDFPARLWQRFGPFFPASSINGSSTPIPANLIQCATLNSANRSALADIHADTGLPYSSKPDSAFWNWYTDCIKAFVDSIYTTNLNQFLNALSPEAAQAIAALGPAQGVSWSNIPDVNKKQLAQGALEFFVSSPIVQEFGADPQAIAVGKIAAILNRTHAERPLKLKDVLVSLMIASASQQFVSLE